MKILLIALVSCIALNAYGQVSVIANKSVSESTVSPAKLSSIYLLETTTWSNGKKIVVFDNSSDVKKLFYDMIGKDQMNIRKEWMKKQLTGEARAPETLSSDEEVLKKVAATPGAIGYVKSSSVTGDVKVVAGSK